MNLNQIQRKLQRALLTKQFVTKIGTSQFYSADQNRMITMYSVSTPTLQYVKGKWKTKDYEIIRTASQVDVVTTLKEMWEALADWQ